MTFKLKCFSKFPHHQSKFHLYQRRPKHAITGQLFCCDTVCLSKNPWSLECTTSGLLMAFNLRKVELINLNIVSRLWNWKEESRKTAEEKQRLEAEVTRMSDMLDRATKQIATLTAAVSWPHFPVCSEDWLGQGGESSSRIENRGDGVAPEPPFQDKSNEILTAVQNIHRPPHKGRTMRDRKKNLLNSFSNMK